MQRITSNVHNIREGMKVSIRKIKCDHKALESLGEGKIRRVADDQISIYVPFLDERISDADKIKVFWEDGRYYYSGTASSFYPHNRPYGLLTIEGLENIVSIEKRRHVRLSRSLNIDYKWIAPLEHIDDFHTRRLCSGIVDNLSCGGLEFITDDRLVVGDLIELGIDLPALTSLMIFTQAKIVRISQSKNQKLPFKVAVQFTTIDPHDRALIAAFILEELREQENQEETPLVDQRNLAC